MSTSPSSPSEASAKPPAAVVADDVVEIQELVAQWLKEAGFTVTCFSTGDAVVRHVRSNPVDLVVTDVLMPDGDGLEVIAELRRTGTSVRILAISGGGRHLQADDCLKFARSLGAHGLLMKPFNREGFDRALRTVMAGGNSPAPG